MSARRDVAVIGAGILGAAAAYYLTGAGRRVVVVEAGEPASGTTGSSFTWVNAVRKEPEAYHRLNAEGVRAWPALARELGGDAGYHGAGCLEWVENGAERDELRARIERIASRGYAARWIRRDEALAMEPGLAIPARVDGVACYDNDAWVDTPRLVRALLDRAVAGGAEVRGSTRVHAVDTRGDRVQGVAVDGGEIHAGAFLFCVGPATQAMLATIGATIPVRRVPGLLAVTSPPAASLGRIVYAPGIHLRPDAGGGLLLGDPDVDRLTTEDTPSGPPPDFALPLLERAQRAFPPARASRIVSVRVGVRPMPGDSYTIAGRIPGFANAWVLVTHSAITMGPLLGQLIAAEIAGAPPSPLLVPFRPDRFPAT